MYGGNCLGSFAIHASKSSSHTKQVPTTQIQRDNRPSNLNSVRQWSGTADPPLPPSLLAHLRCPCDHVLDEIPVARGIDDSDVVFGRLKLPECNVDCDATLTLGF